MKNTKWTRVEEICRAVAAVAGPDTHCWVEHAGDVVAGECPEVPRTPAHRRVGGVDGSEVHACVSGPVSHAWIELFATVVEGDIGQQETIRDMAAATARVWRQTNALLAMASGQSLGLEPARTIQRIFDVLARATRFDGGVALVRIPNEPGYFKLDANGCTRVPDHVFAPLANLGAEVCVLGGTDVDEAIRSASVELMAPFEPSAVARLITERDTFGYLLAVSADALSSDDLKLFGAAARIVAVALENAHTLSTEREATRVEVEQSLYRTLAKSAPVGLFRTDAQGRCVYVNDRWCEVTGVSEAEALEHGWLRAVHDDHLEESIEEWERMLVEDAPFRYELRCRRDDREVWVLAEIAAEMQEDGVGGYVGTLTDITERKRAERENASLEAHLRHAQKMEAIGVMAGGIAHDFNNLLGAIVGNAELARDRIPNDDRARVNLDRLLQGAARARDLVRQMLAFSRQNETVRASQTLAPVVEEALGLIRASVPSCIEMRPIIDDAACRVMADASQLHQVIVNLCTNAYQAIGDEPGDIEIRLTEVDVDEERAAALSHEARAGRYVCLSVCDSGPGVPAEVRERIFDPFFTTKTTRGGSGMGLAVVHGIVVDHGGFLSVANETGRGAKFEMYLPVSEPAAEDAANAAAPAEIGRVRPESREARDASAARNVALRRTSVAQSGRQTLVPVRSVAPLATRSSRAGVLRGAGARALAAPTARSARAHAPILRSEWEHDETLIAHAARWTQLLLDDLDKAPSTDALLPARPTQLLGKRLRAGQRLLGRSGPRLLASPESAQPAEASDQQPAFAEAEEASLEPQRRRRGESPRPISAAFGRRPSSVAEKPAAAPGAPSSENSPDGTAERTRAAAYAAEPADAEGESYALAEPLILGRLPFC